MRFSEGQNPFEVKYATRCFIILQDIFSYVMHSMHAVFRTVLFSEEKVGHFYDHKRQDKTHILYLLQE